MLSRDDPAVNAIPVRYAFGRRAGDILPERSRSGGGAEQRTHELREPSL
jgi:hypothetical protein